MIRGRRARRPTRVFVMRPRRNQITYDYLITNDAEWATVFGLGAATLSGKTIAVAPGNYTSKTISSFNPASTVRVISSSASSKPQIDQLVLNGSGNLQFENLRLVSSSWSATPAPCMNWLNTINNVTLDGCDFVGNYRGVIGDSSFNVDASNYPEYACILPVFNGSGVITGFSVENDLVGDLMANGTYSMSFNNYGGVTFTVAPEATFTVAGGVITGTTLTSGGSSNATLSTGPGIRSRLITWAGQRRMTDWMPSAWRFTAPSTSTGTITIRNCTVDLCNMGFKPALGSPTFIENCTFDRIYQDFISIGSMSPLTIRDCFGTRAFSVLGKDPGDPHSDFVQCIHNGSGAWAGVVMERNIYITGVARGGVQGLFVSDSGSGSYVNPRIVGNAILNTNATNGISCSGFADGFIFANLVARFDPSDTARNTNVVTINAQSSTGDLLNGRNIAESGLVNDTVIFDNGYTNFGLGLNNSALYASVFANPTGPRTTKSQVVAAYTPRTGYENLGPFANTAYIDHVNRITNLTLEPTVCRFNDLSSQTTSTLVTSEWSRIQGGPLTSNAISVTGGEYRIADDAIGTGATAWTTAPGTYARDKFLQLRHTTSATGSSDVTTTATFRGSFTASFRSTTASVASFSSVDNQVIAWSRIDTLGIGESNIQKVVIAVRFQPDALVTAANIISDGAAASPRLWLNNTSSFRFQLVSSGVCQLRPTFTPTLTAKTHIITLDFTASTNGTGCYWATLEDGLILNNTPGSGGTFIVGGSYNSNGVGTILNNSNTLGCFAEGDGGGVILDGKMEFFWMDWGPSSYTIPDITQSSVRNRWTADLIGANGQGPTGSTPKFYYTGNAAAWNAGIANLGSLASRTLAKQAGTYV